MSLRRRGRNEDWEVTPTAARVRVLAWETLPLGRLALLATALVMAYLVLSGTFSSGEVSLASGDACENGLLRDESQRIGGNVDSPGANGQCVQPTATPAQHASALTGAAVVPLHVATTCDDPGYDATLLSPSVPDSSDTYTYVIDGCQPDQDVSAARVGIQWEDIDYVKLSGCWQTDNIKDVHTSAGSVQMIAPDYILVNGISDDDMPLTIEVIFPLSLKSGEERTWIWVHTGPAQSDGSTYMVGGPFCEKASPTPSPTPPPTPTAPPSPATDLTIAKTDSPDPVAIGAVLAYTVTINNIGAIPAEDVFVTDTLPDHVSLISSTPGRGSCDGTMCALGGIAAGDSAVISYVALVTEGAESPIVNVVCAITRTVETDLTHNCDDEETRLKTSLDATSTPNGIPPMGGNPLDGGESAGLSLLLVLGIGLVVIGAVAGLVAGRRPANRR